MVLVSSACLCAGCKTALLPDPTVAHRLAEPAEVDVWVRAPNGALHKERVKFVQGSWCATPEAVEAVKE
jgi:hypothetical protein